MSGPEDKPPERTVFMPGAGSPEHKPAAEDAWFAEPAKQPPAPEPPPAPPVREPEASPSAPAWSSVWDAPPSSSPASPGGAPQDSKIGLVLNDTFELRRLIARGGMGEVYEGAESDGHPVAIKILLPHLAADTSVQALFENEKSVLRRLSHPAIVQYRVFARDRKLGAPYIVMEYVDGPTLSEALASLKPSNEQLLNLTKRLASALASAHELGLVHRDMSPSNVLLPQGQLDKAKIIDFGIAKNLAAGNKTIIGSGFAGTLNYVAPEQFAERSDGTASIIGPWTDVYSLALVILAVAGGKPVPMGATYAEAIEKRKTVPDVAVLPKSLQPVFRAMLAPDPNKRLRSMGEVLQALDRVGMPHSRDEKAARKPRDAKTGKRALADLPSMFWIATAVSVILLFGAVGAVVFWPAPEKIAQAPPPPPPPPPPPIDARVVLQRVNAALPNVDCTWLNAELATGDADNVRVKLSGVAGDLSAATNALTSQAGAPVQFDTADVSPVAAPACGPLNAFRRFRERTTPAAASVSVQQRQFKLVNDRSFCKVGPQPQAHIMADLKPGDAAGDFTLIGLEPSGKLQQLISGRSQFDAMRKASPEFAADLGGGTYRISFCTDEKTARASPNGLVGLVLVKGKGPFTMGLDPKAADMVQVPSDWPQQFAAKAQAQNWTAQIAWYEVGS